MIYFGNPKKHEVAAGAANITIFCQKVSKSCILPEYLGLGEDILECGDRNVIIYHGNPQTHKIARRGANMSCLITKPTKWHVHLAKTQIRLGIRPV